MSCPVLAWSDVSFVIIISIITDSGVICGLWCVHCPAPNMKEPHFPSLPFLISHITTLHYMAITTTLQHHRHNTGSPTSSSDYGVLILTLKKNIIFHHN